MPPDAAADAAEAAWYELVTTVPAIKKIFFVAAAAAVGKEGEVGG